MEKNTLRRYKEKAIDSYKTKINLYIFKKAITSELDDLQIDDFRKFKIDENLVQQYTTEYWQYEPEYQLVNGLTNQEIETRINKALVVNKNLIEEFRNDYIDNVFPTIFAVNDFNGLIETKICHYCKITIEEIHKLANQKKLYKKNYRGWTLEIDRKNSNFEYSKDNCVMACYWCNNAKTDEFTDKEFHALGEALRKIWDERLKSDT